LLGIEGISSKQSPKWILSSSSIVSFEPFF